MHGLLNGKKRLPLADDDDYVQVVQVQDDGPGRVAGLTLERISKTQLVWRAEIEGLRPNPASDAGDSLHVDFRACIWLEASALVLVGDPKAVFLSLSTGQRIGEVDLHFVGKASLEVLELFLSEDHRLLFLGSTKRVVAVDRELMPRWSWVPKGILESARWEPGEGIVVREYMVEDPQLPVAERLLGYAGPVEEGSPV
jgi:hypothetical protein